MTRYFYTVIITKKYFGTYYLFMTSNNSHLGLHKKTRMYAKEIPFLSYFLSISTALLLITTLLLSFFLDILVLKILLAVFAGLLVTRCFILFHDFQHKAIFRESKVAPYVFGLFGLYIFTPPSVWRKSHNFHHAHNTILENSYIGSFWTISLKQWQSMNKLQKIKYEIVRNPLLIFFGMFTVFIYDHCIHSFVRNPRQNWMVLLTLGLHVLVFAMAFYYSQWINYFIVGILPLFIAGCFGTYLFYAQHNFPGVKLMQRKEWNFFDAALQGSSFIQMPKIMHWFTGNIAYHHIHHLNHRIPFYRLPEVMKDIDELQHPITTSLHWKDIMACLRLKLWDEKKQCMIEMKDITFDHKTVTNR